MPVLKSNQRDAVSFEAMPPGSYQLRITSYDGPNQEKPNSLPILWRLENIEDASQSMLHSTPTVGRGAGFLKAFLDPLAASLPSYEVETSEDGRKVLSISYEPDEVVGLVIDAQVGTEKIVRGKVVTDDDRNTLKAHKLAGEAAQNMPSF